MVLVITLKREYDKGCMADGSVTKTQCLTVLAVD